MGVDRIRIAYLDIRLISLYISTVNNAYKRSGPTSMCMDNLVHQTTVHKTNALVILDKLSFENWSCASNPCTLAELDYQKSGEKLLWVAIFMASDCSKRKNIFWKVFVEISAFKKKQFTVSAHVRKTMMVALWIESTSHL